MIDWVAHEMGKGGHLSVPFRANQFGPPWHSKWSRTGLHSGALRSNWLVSFRAQSREYHLLTTSRVITILE